MLRPALLGALLLAPLTAQNVDTLGGTNSPATTGRAKVNILRCDQSVLLLTHEFYMDIQTPETLTFCIYRHNSQNGNYNLIWTKPLPVAGGGGPQWYSPGPIAFQLIAGNHYAIGVAFNTALTYYYKTATSGMPTSFGTWYSGRTPTNPPLQTPLAISGVDIAQYYQRLTTIPISSVVPVGTGCGGTTLQPRLVIDSNPSIGALLGLELVDGTPLAPAIHILAFNPTLPVPIPLLGCSFWLNLAPVSVTFTSTIPASGPSIWSLAVPNNPALGGLRFSSQAGYPNGSVLALTNAVDMFL